MELNETPPETFAPVMMPGLGKTVAAMGGQRMSHSGMRGGDYA